MTMDVVPSNETVTPGWRGQGWTREETPQPGGGPPLRETELDGPVDLGRLRLLWDKLPTPEWTPARADRVYGELVRKIARRRRFRHLAMLAAASLALPPALVLASRLLQMV